MLECAPREPQETGLKIQLRAPFKGPPSAGQSGNGRGGEKTPCFFSKGPPKKPPTPLSGEDGPGRAGRGKAEVWEGRGKKPRRGQMCLSGVFFFFLLFLFPSVWKPLLHSLCPPQTSQSSTLWKQVKSENSHLHFTR